MHNIAWDSLFMTGYLAFLIIGVAAIIYIASHDDDPRA
jgi:hypothetical protein|tara:strand:+ start:211 stop:324 length:114 start_codon:yes stop_codon:yes gene_type:complete